MFRKAMLPTDGSELSMTAVEHLQRLLGPDSTALVVEVVDTVERLLVQTTPAGFGLGPMWGPGIPQEIVRAQHEAAALDLARVREQLAQAGITKVETRILEGEPGETLVQAARTEHCDVVVMATRGRSGFRRAMLGSVADHVVRHLTGIPVLLVHPNAEDAEEHSPAPVEAHA